MERVDRLRLLAPPNVHVWCAKKAWVSNVVVREYVSLLGRCLRAYRRRFRIILYMDVFRTHMSPPILQSLALAREPSAIYAMCDLDLNPAI